MPIGTGVALAIAGGMAAAGGVAGAVGSKSEQSQTSGVELNPASALQNQAQSATSEGLSGFGQMVNAGPGANDVSAYTSNSRDLASMLAEYSKTGGLPGQEDINTSNGIADKLFGAQREQLRQNFQDQQWSADQQAALMGRSGNDPILRAKLAQDQTRQQALLQGQQGSVAQQLALQQPLQRLGFAQAQNQMLGGLASQALANRQALAAMGSGILGQQQAYQLATSKHYGTQTQSSGGGIGGAITGALGGFGAGLGAMKGFVGGADAGGGGGGFGGGGGGGGIGSYFSQSNPFSSMGRAPASAPSLGGMVPLSNSFLGIGGQNSTPNTYFGIKGL